MGSINEGGGFMQKLLSVDFYRKLPDDVAHATKTGAILSWAAAFLMGLLFLTELWERFSFYGCPPHCRREPPPPDAHCRRARAASHRLQVG